MITSIFKRRLLANQRLLQQDPLSRHGHPEPFLGWASPTGPSPRLSTRVSVARRRLSLPLGCGAGGNPTPAGGDLRLCWGRGCCLAALQRAPAQPRHLLREPAPEHGLEGGKRGKDPTGAPPKGGKLRVRRMRIYMKVLPIHALINTLSHPTAARSCSLPREGVPSPAQQGGDRNPAWPRYSPPYSTGRNHLHERPEHQPQQTVWRPPRSLSSVLAAEPYLTGPAVKYSTIWSPTQRETLRAGYRLLKTWRPASLGRLPLPTSTTTARLHVRPPVRHAPGQQRQNFASPEPPPSPRRCLGRKISGERHQWVL